MEKTFTWVYNIVDSCNNDFHFASADALIALFWAKYGDCEKLQQLKELRHKRWVAIHEIMV